MPLSEEEQRILAQIEESLRASDPKLAQHVASAKVPSDVKKRMRLSIVALVVGLVASILLLSVSYVLAFIGFLAAFGALMFVQSDIKGLGRVRIAQARKDFQAGIRESFRDSNDSGTSEPGGPTS